MHPDPRSVLGALAADVYGHPSDRVVVLGVTGTSGKTTTAHLIESGLRAAGRIPGMIGTVGVRIAGSDVPSALTTPEAPALQALLAVMAERSVDTAVMEVSSRPGIGGSTASGSRWAASPICPATTSISTPPWEAISKPRRG